MQTDLLIKNLEVSEINGNLNNLTNWSDVDWKKVNSTVTQLRSRIFACKKNGNLKKLRSLQRLMLNSKSNYLLSVRKVTYASGRKSAGIDAKTALDPSSRLKLFYDTCEISLHQFNPKPSKRIHLIKPDGSPRPIGIPTIQDRVLQNVVKNALEPEWEAVFEGYSYGFRPGRSVNDAVSRTRSILIPKKRVWVLEVDVAKCFDSISHDYIMEQVKYFPASSIIKKWLESGILLEGVWLQTETGTPQGGVISPLLCNIAMHGVGSEIGVKTNADGRIRPDSPHSLVIYADDMVIFSDSKNGCYAAKEKLEISLNKRGLKLNKAKTIISHAYSGFDFLGFHFVIKNRFGRYNTKNWIEDNGNIKLLAPTKWVVPIARPSDKSISSIKNKISEIYKIHSANCDLMVLRLNRIIRGWANSKRFWYTWPTFKHLDYYCWNLQIRWLRRRHPSKGTYWRNAKYYSLGTQPDSGFKDKWTFRAPGSTRPLLKFYWFFSSNQKDWVQIASDMKPDDPSSLAKNYFKERTNQLFDRKLVDLTCQLDRSLAKRQSLVCPLCNESLFNGESIHRHHIIERSKGGSDKPSNLALVHLPCHYNFHYSNKRNLLDSRFESANLKAEILGVKPVSIIEAELDDTEPTQA